MGDEKKKEEKKKDERKFHQKKRYRFLFGLILLVIVSSIWGGKEVKRLIEECNNGSIEACKELENDWSSYLESESDKAKITNPYLTEKFKKEAVIKEAKEKKKAEEKRRRAEEQAKQDALLGKMIMCKEILKASLKDPSSFKEVNSILDQMRTGVIVYSATNSFGGRIQSKFDCNG